MIIDDNTLFKATGFGATPCHGGYGKWHKPHSYRRPGKWMPLIEGIYPCVRGYHICKGEQVLHWLNEELYEVEIKGEQIREDNKIVASEARLVRRITTWNKRTARLFACDCAEHVLFLFRKKFPSDSRPREVIDVARRYANGKATEEELGKARHGAAIANYTAGNVAFDVYTDRDPLISTSYSIASYAARAAEETARIGAHHAAYIAAEDAVSAVTYGCRLYSPEEKLARSQERAWQWNRLLKYLNGEIS